MSEMFGAYEAKENLTFSRKPIALPADIRPFRKIGQILLILFLASSKGMAPILKLQFFNSLFINPEAFNDFLDHFTGEKIPVPHVSLDPFMNRAISQAAARGYIETLDNGNIQLLDKGKALATVIMDDDEIMGNEKELLTTVRKKISNAQLNRILKL